MARISKGIQVPLSWVPSIDGNVPETAIDAGDLTYICRAEHSGDLIPGKYDVKSGNAFVTHDEAIHKVKNIEVLCSTPVPQSKPCYEWKKGSKGQVPSYAVVGGQTKDGKPLYIARKKMENGMTVGKVQSGDEGAKFPYSGEEETEEEYEVLVFLNH